MVSFPSFSKNELIQFGAKISFSENSNGKTKKGAAYLGCNTLVFDYQFKNNGKVRISNLLPSQKTCEDINLETSFINLIQGMNKYKLEGHFLTLSDSNGNEIKYVAADWD